MEITDIIGAGKAFEPPFRETGNGIYVIDKNNHIVTRVEGFEHLRHLFSESQLFGEVYPTLAYHICDLLNREHCNEGGK